MYDDIFLTEEEAYFLLDKLIDVIAKSISRSHPFKGEDKYLQEKGEC